MTLLAAARGKIGQHTKIHFDYIIYIDSFQFNHFLAVVKMNGRQREPSEMSRPKSFFLNRYIHIKIDVIDFKGEIYKFKATDSTQVGEIFYKTRKKTRRGG